MVQEPQRYAGDLGGQNDTEPDNKTDGQHLGRSRPLQDETIGRKKIDIHDKWNFFFLSCFWIRTISRLAALTPRREGGTGRGSGECRISAGERDARGVGGE